MGAPLPPPTSLPLAEDRRLDSWKEIAAYLNRDVTTVQRWEKREAMPVHRHLHDRAGSIYAFQSELDAWVRARTLRATPERTFEEPEPVADTPAPAPPAVSSPRPARAIWLPAAVLAIAAFAAAWWLHKTEYFWRSPIADAQLQTVTDFEGVAQAAALSADGHFAAFLSDRDGVMDVWVTQVGSGEFHNLTNGSAPELVNPSIRTLGFSPDGSMVTFWVRRQPAPGNIAIWAVPTLGGQPRPYLEGAAELDWSRDGSRLAYHTPGPGDPLYVSDGLHPSAAKPVFTAPSGLHSHFPLWSPDNAFLYYVQGVLPDKLDIWRISPSGGVPERITNLEAHVSHPVFLDARTLLFLASDRDGSGPFLYSLDVERRIPHRLSAGLDRYTSLAASADGRRLVATAASTRRTLWKIALPPMTGAGTPLIPSPEQVSPGATSMFSPRLGPGYLFYVSATAAGERIWRMAEGIPAEVWNGKAAHVMDGPAIAPDGRAIAFCAQQDGRTLLHVMQADGSNPHTLAEALDFRGSPAWTPDGQALTVAAEDHGVPHLFRVPLDGSPPSVLVSEYSLDPAWAPDGTFAAYSGPDIGTKFSVKSVTAAGAPHSLPDLALTRGARHLVFVPARHALVFLSGEITHKNLWQMDLENGAQSQITNLPPGFDVRDFDISPDGRILVVERAREHSEVVLIDLPRH